MSTLFEERAQLMEKEKPQGDLFEERATMMDKPSTLNEFAQQTGRKFLSGVGALPREAAELLSGGSQALARLGEEQAASEGREVSPKEKALTGKVLKAFDYPLRLLDKIGYPTQQQIEESLLGLSSLTGVHPSPLQPESAAGRIGSEVGEFAKYAAIGSPAQALSRLGFGALSGAGAGVAAEMGAGAGGQMGVAMALPFLLHAATQIKSGKLVPSSAELEALYASGRKMGLTNQELTPLLQSEGKLKGLGRVARISEQAKESLSSTEAKLGAQYDILRAQASTLPPSSKKSTGILLNDLEKIQDRLLLSKLPGTDKQAVIGKINNLSFDVAANGVTAPEIMATWQDINSTVNWNAYSGGKKDLASLKQPLKETLKRIDPKVAKDFEILNALYSKNKVAMKAIGPDSMKNMINYGKAGLLLTSVAKAAVGGDLGGAGAAIGSYITAGLLQKLMGQMLTNPRYQQLGYRTINSIKKGTRQAAFKAVKDLSSQLIQDFPDEALQVDWDGLMRETLTPQTSRPYQGPSPTQGQDASSL